MKYHIFFEPDTKDSYLKRGELKNHVPGVCGLSSTF